MIGSQHVLTGLSQILNADNFKGDIDVNELEQRMIKQGLIDGAAVVQGGSLHEELRLTASKLGLDLGDLLDTTPPPPPLSAPPEPVTIQEEEEPEPAIEMPAAVAARTIEQKRRDRINQVNNRLGALNSFSFEQEKREEKRCQMLEEINFIIKLLREEDADVDNLPVVDKHNSTYEEIEDALRIVNFKYERIKYCAFANECVLLGLQFIEGIFDGKQEFFGRKFDLRGYSNTDAHSKLRRMKYSLSEVVSGTMQSVQSRAPWLGIALELVPSLILYGLTNNEAGDGDSRAKSARRRIRDYSNL